MTLFLWKTWCSCYWWWIITKHGWLVLLMQPGLTITIYLHSLDNMYSVHALMCKPTLAVSRDIVEIESHHSIALQISLSISVYVIYQYIYLCFNSLNNEFTLCKPTRAISRDFLEIGFHHSNAIQEHASGSRYNIFPLLNYSEVRRPRLCQVSQFQCRANLWNTTQEGAAIAD